MAKLELPIIVNCTEIDELIDEIKHLQTYKLFEGDEQVLIDRDDTIEIFAKHIRASARPEQKVGKWIKMSDADGLYYCCSECGEELYRERTFDRQFDLFPKLKTIDKTTYCPNCGSFNGGE